MQKEHFIQEYPFFTIFESGAPLDILKMFANLLSQTALSNTFSAFQKQLNFYATQNIGEKSEIFFHSGKSSSSSPACIQAEVKLR